MSSLNIPISILKDTYEKERSVINLRKSKDSVNRLCYFFNMNAQDIEFSKKDFNRTFGNVSDGNSVDIGTTDPYFKIVSDIILIEYYATGKVLNLTDVAKQDVPAFHLYINGNKIPDSEIKIYCTNSHTDIFVPLQRVNNLTNMDILVESNTAYGKEYICDTFKASNSVIFEINLEKIEAGIYEKIDPNNFLIYVNGVLEFTDIEVEHIKEANILRLRTENALSGEVEILYNPDIKYRVLKQMNSRTTHIIYDLKGYMNVIKGPIPKKLCSFYINGKKIANELIRQRSRHHFTIDFDEAIDVTYYEVIVSDLGMVDDKSYLVMSSDYYLHKMLGNDRIANYYNYGKTTSKLDPYDIDINDALNKHDVVYTESKTVQRLNYLERSDDDTSEKLKNEIVNNPTILKHFLKHYSQRTRNFIVKPSQITGEYIKIGTDTKFGKDERPYFNIYINRQFLPHTEYKIDDEYILYIPKSLLKEGDNTIEINEFSLHESKTGLRYLSYMPTDMTNNYFELDKGIFECDIVIHKNSIADWWEDNLDDIIVLERNRDDTSLLYPSERNVGYVRSTTAELTEEEDTITIHFRKTPTDLVLVYFKNFAYTATIQNQNNPLDHNSNLIFLFEHSKTNPIPVIPKGLPNLYLNGTLLVNGVDYTYSTPENNLKVAGSVISMIKKMEKGDYISLVFEEVENNEMMTVTKPNYISKYGLLYFGSFPFPFALDYLDLFIDGKKVSAWDIDILSDKLIRVRDLAVPFKSIFVRTKFKEDYSKLSEFFDVYKRNETQFEKKIGEIFSGVDFTRRVSDDAVSGNPDDVFLDFDSVGIIQVPIEENPENTVDETERSSLLVTIFSKWLHSEDARFIVDLGQNISKEVLDYFALYDLSGSSGNRRDIVLPLGERCISGTDLRFNMNQIPPKDHEKLKTILDKLLTLKKNIPLSDVYKEFVDNPISNQILPIDFPFAKDKRSKVYWTWKGDNIVIQTGGKGSIDSSYNPRHHKIHFKDRYKYKKKEK